MLLRRSPLATALRVLVSVCKPLVVSALFQQGMQGVLHHIQVKGLAGSSFGLLLMASRHLMASRARASVKNTSSR